MRAPSEFLASLVWEERLTRDGLEVAELLEHQLLGDEVLRTKKARAGQDYLRQASAALTRVSFLCCFD